MVGAQTVNLPAPNKAKKTATVMEALAARHSERAFSDKKLTGQELSDLLWATTGKNREDGKLTAPTAMNRQEIRVYVFTADKVSEYLPQTNQLQQTTTGDHRAIVAGRQEAVKNAPVMLLLVADLDKFKSNNQHAQQMVAVDTGILLIPMVGIIRRAFTTHDARAGGKHSRRAVRSRQAFRTPAVAHIDSLQVAAVHKHIRHVRHCRRVEATQVEGCQRRASSEHIRQSGHALRVEAAQVDIR